MPVEITVHALDRVGFATPAQVDGDVELSNEFENPSSRAWVEIENTDGADQTVDFALVAAAVDGVAVPPKTITIPAGEIRSFGNWPKAYYNQNAIAADNKITSDGTNPANNDTVTIDGHVYTFKSTLTGAANEVKIGANAAATLANLKAAINDSGGVEGTDYGTGTTAHATVAAAAITSTVLVVSARTDGAAGSAIAVSESSAHLSWAHAMLVGGQGSGYVLASPSSANLKFRAYSI